MATAKTNGAAALPDEVRDLSCKLMDTELQKRGKQMSDVELEVEQWKLERAGVSAKIRKGESRRAELAHVIEKGEETRPVRCAWSADYAKNVWRLHRTDTHAEVDTRAMTASDRNGELDFADTTKPKKASKTKKPAPPAAGETTKATRPPRKAPLHPKASKQSHAQA